MKIRILFFVVFVLAVCTVQPARCEDASGPVNPRAAEPVLTVGEILDKVKNRYAGPGFSARFSQESTLKAMEITDTASGKMWVKRPGKMRWEYEKPDRQIIISDGKKLWIYRPDDRQVMTGEAPAYFGAGKGASFLSDIEQITEHFNISLETVGDDSYYGLKLLPKEKKGDLSVVYLLISRRSFEVLQIVTINAYGDETRIRLDDFKFKLNPDDALFSFKIPEGVDVLQLDK